MYKLDSTGQVKLISEYDTTRISTVVMATTNVKGYNNHILHMTLIIEFQFIRDWITNIEVTGWL